MMFGRVVSRTLTSVSRHTITPASTTICPSMTHSFAFRSMATDTIKAGKAAQSAANPEPTKGYEPKGAGAAGGRQTVENRSGT